MSKKKQSDSVSKILKYREKKDTSEVVDYVYERLSHGASDSEIEIELKIKFKWSRVRARTMIDACTDIAFRLNPEYVTQIAGQIKFGTAQTLQSLDMMLAEAKTYDQKVDLIKAKQRTLEGLHKLLPKQIDIATTDKSLKDLMFDLYDLDEE
jgi:hypothetical protein